ncbi:MAG: hypothetical protein HYS26_01050 [Candidatus Kaiserbacteria bacterium]|nr:MAG: hypothetical protein HYS26_01050 [Candidatus Kaiserbacteria bacterium]
MQHRLSFKQLFAILFLAFAALLAASSLSAWVGPTASPPDDNVPAPVNVGTTDQIKSAGLSLDALAVFGSQYVEDKLGIGRVSPVVALDVDGTLRLGNGDESCQAVTAGSIRFNSGTSVIEFCNGVEWSTLTGSGSAPSGAVMAFDLTACPSGWSEYTPAYGRFIRGIDKSGTSIDPSGQRAPGSTQGDDFGAHTHSAAIVAGTNWTGESYTYSFSGTGNGSTGSAGGSETRPKNVALLYCEKS